MLIDKMYGFGVEHNNTKKASKSLNVLVGGILYKIVYFKGRKLRNSFKKYHYDKDSFAYCINNGLIIHKWFFGITLTKQNEEE